MSEQSARDIIFKNTMQVLAAHTDLSPAELAHLRLADLHLAGKSPNVSFVPAGSDQPRVVELDLEAHRALVGWLVARPDSKSDFLFPGRGDGPLEPPEIEQLLKAGAPAQKAGPRADEAGAKPPEPPAGTVPPPPAGDETMVRSSRPVAPPARPMPPPSRPLHPLSRPEPPPTRPEMGPPPESPEATGPSLRPPPSSPELDNVDIPLPMAAPKPPPPPPLPSTEFDEADEAEELPEETPAAASETEKPEADGPAPPDATPAGPEQPESAPKSGPAPPAPVRQAGPKKPPPPKRPVTGPPPGTRAPSSADPKAPVTAEEAAARAAGSGQRPTWSRLVVSGSVAVIIVTCVLCLGGGWLAAQSGPGQSLLAMVGMSSQVESTPTVASTIELTETVEAAVTVTPVVTTVFESPLDSPLPTPTATPTEPATATPVPPTAAPTNTPAPPPTNTPLPTDTPVPTNTPVAEAPADTPTPEEPPTPAMKYGAPVLIEPEDGYAFIQGNTIVLRWEPVGELAPDEQYAVRMVYSFQNQPTYQGANIKETEWQVPLSLFGQVDGPENKYEWYVSVERLNDDGSGTPISPESERRTFTWR